MSDPFKHYPGDPGAAEVAGTQAKNQAAVIDALKYDLAHQSDAAANQASGQIDGAVRGAANTPKSDMAKVQAAALVTGAASYKFARAIRFYNTNIDGYNTTYNAAKANDFYVPADAGHVEGHSKAENDEARAAKIAAADKLLLAQLEKNRQQSEAYLDDEADDVAAILIAGPTAATILTLYLGGDIGEHEAGAALGLSSVEPLRNARTAAATANSALGYTDTLPALAAYLARQDPGTLDGHLSKSQLAELSKILGAQRSTLDSKIAALKSAQKDWRIGARMATAAKPGTLFGTLGSKLEAALPQLGRLAEKVPAIGVAARGLGKAMPFLGVASGVYGIANTLDRREELTVPDFVAGIVGGAAGIVGGAAGIGLLIGGAPAAAGGLGAVAVGAGIIGVGSLVFENREEIAGWVADRVDDIGSIPTGNPLPGLPGHR